MQLLIDMMVGRSVSPDIDRLSYTEEKKEELVRVKDLTTLSADGRHKTLDNVSFSAYSGEVLGITDISASVKRERAKQ